ncbi:AMP-dependent synthetase [Nakamurella flava]|uniref:AMP-dependent synthetase n=1 Tax=Nakamurella flava TaxID=2576308 RepID=A0A4U6QEK9_9ACTN|nr:AMP-binding protein [Nakamurella flava]TKV58422.1 AMP-dependent synthetase [Nakamurella flava]
MTEHPGPEPSPTGAPTAELRAARDFLLATRSDRTRAVAEFSWPRPVDFNWALDWFDVVAAEHPHRPALVITDGRTRLVRSYGDLSRRSDQVAAWLRANGLRRGDRVLVMLGNQVELWEVLLAAMKVGAVVVPASTLLRPADLQDRIDRGRVAFVVARSVDTADFRAVTGTFVRIAVGDPEPGWIEYADSTSMPTRFVPDGPTPAAAPLLEYFTSGTTARPKLVQHSHVSYPIGHLTTMYWIGLQPGDVHLNISSPGWAKHAWSNVFAPWLAGATVLVHSYERFDAAALLRTMDTEGVTTFCAPPTVWRMLLQSDLSVLRTPPRELVAAGEPLNPEVVARTQQAWGRTVRDGFGQTEMTLAVGNSPGQPVRAGSMGRPMPGYRIGLLDVKTGEPAAEGELAVDLRGADGPPVPLMTGYAGDADRTAEATAAGWYRTGDVATVDDDGYLTYVGRADDVFKASDYRISPFELESVLLRSPAVAEAAVVPSPHPTRLAVPKAFVVLADGYRPDAAVAQAIFAHSQRELAPYQRIRRLEFADLPKTISGKIRRVELRERESARSTDDLATGGPGEYRAEDFSGD